VARSHGQRYIRGVDAGDLIANRFRIIEKAGSGGMGTVYRGVDLTTNEPVAIKVLRRDAEIHAERFVREAAVLAGLSHAGIVSLIDHGVEPGAVRYLVQEWINGTTLRARMLRVGLTAPESVTVALGVGQANLLEADLVLKLQEGRLLDPDAVDVVTQQVVSVLRPVFGGSIPQHVDPEGLARRREAIPAQDGRAGGKTVCPVDGAGDHDAASLVEQKVRLFR